MRCGTHILHGFWGSELRYSHLQGHLPSQRLCFLDQHLPQGCASKTCPWASVCCTVIGNYPKAYDLVDLTGSAMDVTRCLMSLKSSSPKNYLGVPSSPHTRRQIDFSAACVQSVTRNDRGLQLHIPLSLFSLLQKIISRGRSKSQRERVLASHRKP